MKKGKENHTAQPNLEEWGEGDPLGASGNVNDFFSLLWLMWNKIMVMTLLTDCRLMD